MNPNKRLQVYLSPILLAVFLTPLYGNSTSNTAKLDLAKACPVLPERATGENFAYKLHHMKKAALVNRFANIWYNPDKQISTKQTLVFYWHGTDGVTDEIDTAFGKNGVQRLVDQGYVVVSPDHIRDGKGNGILKYSWYIANGSRLNHDVVFGDLIVECLNEKFKAQFKVISAGCSAGAMQSALWSFQNRDVIGSILYSGGIFRLPEFAPRQSFWSVVTHGGVTDKRGDFDFMKTAIHIHHAVLKLGYPSALCDFAPQGHDIHGAIANNFPDIIVDPQNVPLPQQCSRERKKPTP